MVKKLVVKLRSAPAPADDAQRRAERHASQAETLREAVHAIHASRNSAPLEELFRCARGREGCWRAHRMCCCRACGGGRLPWPVLSYATSVQLCCPGKRSQEPSLSVPAGPLCSAVASERQVSGCARRRPPTMPPLPLLAPPPSAAPWRARCRTTRAARCTRCWATSASARRPPRWRRWPRGWPWIPPRSCSTSCACGRPTAASSA